MTAHRTWRNTWTLKLTNLIYACALLAIAKLNSCHSNTHHCKDGIKAECLCRNWRSSFSLFVFLENKKRLNDADLLNLIWFMWKIKQPCICELTLWVYLPKRCVPMEIQPNAYVSSSGLYSSNNSEKWLQSECRIIEWCQRQILQQRGMWQWLTSSVEGAWSYHALERSAQTHGIRIQSRPWPLAQKPPPRLYEGFFFFIHSFSLWQGLNVSFDHITLQNLSKLY